MARGAIVQAQCVRFSMCSRDADSGESRTRHERPAFLSELPDHVKQTWTVLEEEPILGIYGFQSAGWEFSGSEETDHGTVFFFANFRLLSCEEPLCGLAAVDWNGRSFWVSRRTHTQELEMFLLEAWMPPNRDLFGHAAIVSSDAEPTEAQFREWVVAYARNVPDGP